MPDDFETIAPERLAAISPEKPASNAPAAASGETSAAAPFKAQMETGFSSADASPGNEDFRQWRKKALETLNLELVYGPLLTGPRAGEGWLECRDPASKSGDRNPSASVADGTGQAERGAFHSFRSEGNLSVFDFLVWRGMALDFSEAVREVARLSGVPLACSARR